MKTNDLTYEMIAQGKLPSEVYKFIKIDENLLKTLINGEIWFPSPLSFNDPFDCQIDDQTDWSYESIRKYLTSIFPKTENDQSIEAKIKEYNLTPENFSKYYTEKQKLITSRYGVTCFTNRPCNMLMWAHYADSHKGICMKFDILKDNTDFFNLTFKVDYTTKFPKINFVKDVNEAGKIIMTTKSEYWNYENEIRTIKSEGDKNYPFDKNSLVEIIFGINTSEVNIKTIKSICSCNGYPDVKFKRVVIKPQSFNFEVINL